MGDISLFIGGAQEGFLPASLLSEVDPVRMTDDQLKQVIVETANLKRIKPHLHEFSQRNNLPLDWYDEDIATYVKTDVEPPKTPNGLWVRSVLREQRKVLSLTEYRDYALGYITLPTDVTAAMACNRIRGLILAAVGDVVYRWTDAAVLQFVIDRTEPARTSLNVLIVDMVRDKQEFIKWRDVELVELFKGNVVAVAPNTLDKGIADARRRFVLPLAWSDAEVMDYTVNQVVPPKTSEGDWINDIERIDKPFHLWTDSELIGLVRGEITIPDTANINVAFREMRERWYYTDDASNERITADVQELGIAISDRPVEFLDHELNNFKTVMTDELSTRIDKAIVHTQLYKATRRVLRLPLEKFLRVWKELLDFAEVNDVLFSGKDVFEGSNYANLTNRQMAVYTQILVIIVNTKYVSDRYTLTRGEFSSLFEALRDGVAEGKLTTFYKV